MECRECGAEVQVGSFFCGGCGRPVWAPDADRAPDVEEPDLSLLPPPGHSREGARPALRGESFFICAGCMESLPLRDARRVGGRNYCSACAPEAAETAEPEKVALPASMLVRERDLGGFGRYWLIGALVAVLGIGIAFALPKLRGGDRIDRLRREAVEGGDRAFSLAARYQAGQMLAYDLRLRLTAEARGDGMAGVMPEGAMEARCTLWVEVLAVDEAGNADLRIRTEDVALSLPEGATGMPGMSTGRGLEELEAVLHVDPYGEPLQPPEVLSGDPSLVDNLFAVHSGVPRRELRAGEGWTSREDLPLGPMPGGGEGRIGVQAAYHVDGLVKHMGRDCAVISFEGGVDEGSAGLDFRNLMDVSLDASVKGVGFVETATGILVKNACDVEVRIEISADGNSAEVEMRLEFDLELR